MNRKIVATLILIFPIMIGYTQKKDYVVTIKTQYGDMIAILYDETPKHKENFIKLAKEHFYDSLLFHRVIEGFMIQGGDPESRNAKPGQQLGSGGLNYTIDAEINPKFFHEKGALAAARRGDAVNPTKASSSSQFYIVQGQKFTRDELTIDPQKMSPALKEFFDRPENEYLLDTLTTFYHRGDRKGYEKFMISLKPRIEQQLGISVEKDNINPEIVQAYTTVGGTPHLDGEYTVFGKVIKGLEVIDKIASLPRDSADRPLEDVHMIVTVEEMPKKKIEKRYGYRYEDQEK